MLPTCPLHPTVRQARPSVRLASAVLLLVAAAPVLPAVDCDLDGIDDAAEIATGAPDCNANGVLDECEVRSVAGAFRLAPEVLLGHIVFTALASDLDDDGAIDVAVLIYRAVVTLMNDGSGGLSEKHRLPVSQNAEGLVPGDFDGDGDLDLLALAPNDRQIQVLLNSGQGAFESAGSFPGREAWRQGSAGATADLDQDGDLDVAMGTLDSLRIGIGWNTGAAAFPAIEYVFVGQDQRSVVATDVDGEGRMDLAVGGSRSVIILRSQGAGDFAAPEAHDDPGPVIDGPTPDLLVSGDLDGDLSADLLFGERRYGRMGILFGDGSGNFTDRRELDGARSLWHIAIADLDGDGHNDVVGANFGGFQDNEADRTVSILRNRGTGDRAGLFEPESKCLTGDRPAVALPIDLDGDGDLDVVTGNATSQSLSVLWNRGGRLGEGVQFSNLERPGFVKVFDGDGDGDLDLAVKSYGVSLIYLFENEEGGHFAQVPAATGVPQSITIESGDLDEDGRTDLVAGPSWLRAREGLSFDPARSLPVQGVAAGLGVVAVQDLDANGDLDLVIADTSSNTLAIVRGSGDGEFTKVGTVAVVAQPFGAVARDFDGDGMLDLAIGLDRYLSVATAEGDMTFGVPVNQRVSAPVLQVRSADLDADGWLDVVGETGSEGIPVLWNEGDGRFAPLSRMLPGGVFTLEDVDRDGKLDFVATASIDGIEKIVILENRDERAFRRQETALFIGQVRGISGADFDASGSIDIAFSDFTFTAGALTIVYGDETHRAADCNGDGVPDACQLDGADCDLNGILDACQTGARLLTRPSEHFSVGRDPFSVVARDWNGDGAPDLSSADFTSGTLSLLVNDGRARFDPAGKIDIPYPTAVTGADLDGDGDLDIAATSAESSATAPQTVVTFHNDGMAGFSNGQTMDVGRAPSDVLALDLDGDGNADLCAVHCRDPCDASAVTVLHNLGNGIFVDPAVWPLPLRARAVHAADLNGDGHLDLAVNGALSFIMLLFSEGGTGYGEPRLVGAGSEPGSFGEGDFDGDGDLDLAATDRNAGSVRVLENDGRGAFGPGRVFPGGPAPVSLAPADVDRDGRPDLVVASQGAPGSLDFLRNEGHDEFSFVPGSSIGGNPRALGAADLDGDSDADFYLVDASSAAVIVVQNDTPPFDSANDDCNRNGVPDGCDLSSGYWPDSDGDGVLDECRRGTFFHRGDPNSSGRMDLSDGLFILRFLFQESELPSCRESADVNNDGKIDITDGISVFNYLFVRGKAPASPGPPGNLCGLDSDPPGSNRALGCELYDRC